MLHSACAQATAGSGSPPDKISYENFYGVMISEDSGLKSFVICGIATEIGIEPTVRQGADLG